VHGFERRHPRRTLIAHAVLGAAIAVGCPGAGLGAQSRAPVAEVYPDSSWTTLPDLAASGYDPARFEALRARVAAEGTSAMLVVAGGRVVFSFGDVARPTYLASARKSVVSMMYGRPVRDGTVRLDATLASLGIDDDGGLLPVERAATVGDLLASPRLAAGW
jgi:CubicO group peptidase (beta-lactamase class C family)